MVTPSRARAPPCTRAHQIGALALASIVFFFARSLDRPATCVYSPSPPTTSLFDHAGTFRWPERGYGSVLSLKIYVYDEREIDGLRALLRGRDGRISAESCFKGQWGTQVCIAIILSFIDSFHLGEFSLSWTRRNGCFFLISQDSISVISRDLLPENLGFVSI